MKNTNAARRHLDDIIAIQHSPGNWDYDPYMHGMLNGLIAAKWVVFDIAGIPDYAEAPDKWLSKDRLEELHNQHPALKNAYDEYVFLLNIIKGQDSERYLQELHNTCGSDNNSLPGGPSV